ncbi:MAG TPA: phage tail sheath C-terminal domain-containing protein [Allosphingosinicella sp.]|jgi:hypothetical protein
MESDRKTPDVYIRDLDNRATGVVGVATSAPIFIGYTERAIDPNSGKPLHLRPFRISSLVEFQRYFGAGFDAVGVVRPLAGASGPADPLGRHDFVAESSDGGEIASRAFTVAAPAAGSKDGSSAARFALYPAIQLFFHNGGSNCFIISVGDYRGGRDAVPVAGGEPAAVSGKDLLEGIEAAREAQGGTALVVPDAALLRSAAAAAPEAVSGYGAVAVAMLDQAAELQDRMAILDLPGALDPSTWDAAGMRRDAEAFYAAIAPAAGSFSYGCAYAPALQTTFLTSKDLSYVNLKGSPASIAWMNNILTTEALQLFPPVYDGSGRPTHSAAFRDVAAHIAAAFPVAAAAPREDEDSPVRIADGDGPLLVAVGGAGASEIQPGDDARIAVLDAYLLNALPLYGTVKARLAQALNVVAPSGAIAGIWSRCDRDAGVWKAPANVNVAKVSAPLVAISDAEQAEYNTPLNGHAINVIRAFNGRGVLVWGARTLDANSPDYRFISIRRTLIYVEQSIRLGLQMFVFSSNDAGTWAAVKDAISTFLTEFWNEGGLLGASATEAFSVECGLGSTMTADDVLDRTLRVMMTLQLAHPAEFIELTFAQSMEN